MHYESRLVNLTTYISFKFQESDCTSSLLLVGHSQYRRVILDVVKLYMNSVSAFSSLLLVGLSIKEGDP